jgi:hypothetical protein
MRRKSLRRLSAANGEITIPVLKDVYLPKAASSSNDKEIKAVWQPLLRVRPSCPKTLRKVTRLTKTNRR